MFRSRLDLRTTAGEATERLATLLRQEQVALGDFLVARAEFDDARGWAELGHGSLLTFLTRELKLSKSAAHYRQVAARLIRTAPEVIEPLRDGRLCVTAVVELAKVMTPENRREVLPRFFHASKQEARAVAAQIAPAAAPPLRDVTTPVRSTPASTLALSKDGSSGADRLRGVGLAEPVPQDLTQALSSVADVCCRTPEPPRHPNDRPDQADRGLTQQRPAGRSSREVTDPLTADLRRLHITVSRRFLKKLEAAKDALSHSHPGGRTEEVLETALDLLLAQSARRKGLVKKPRAHTTTAQPSRPSSRPRTASADGVASPPHADRPDHRNIDPVPDARTFDDRRVAVRHRDAIPAAVRRAVWERDQGRCQWKVEGGGVCGATARLEIDHVYPHALGGASTVANTRVLCHFHNQRAAVQQAPTSAGSGAG